MKWFYPLNVQSYTVQTSEKVNVSSGKPTDRTQADVSACRLSLLRAICSDISVWTFDTHMCLRG